MHKIDFMSPGDVFSRCTTNLIYFHFNKTDKYGQQVFVLYEKETISY